MAEIERKFLLASPPPTELLGPGEEILQGYLLVHDGELRIRRKGDRCFLTVKGDGALSRDEWEVEAPAWVFETLWPRTKGARVEKTRHSVVDCLDPIEVDIYHGHLGGLATLECEFPDKEAAEAFELPGWAEDAVEVTANKAYKNKNLAVSGLPPA